MGYGVGEAENRVGDGVASQPEGEQLRARLATASTSSPKPHLESETVSIHMTEEHTCGELSRETVSIHMTGTRVWRAVLLLPAHQRPPDGPRCLLRGMGKAQWEIGR